MHSREQMAQKKRSPRESLSLILPLKKIGNGTKQSSKVEMSGRMLKLRIDRRIICIDSDESKCRSIESLFCRV